jgi:hypothetical protein
MSQYIPERLDAAGINLTNRFAFSTAVAASPALAAETVICTLTIPQGVQVFTGVSLEGSAAFTIGTSGTAYTLKIRQTGTSGTVIYSSGLIAASAASLQSPNIAGIDTSPANAQVYVLTLTVANGAATSTVSAANLTALLV